MSQARHQQQAADGRKKVGSGNLDAYAEIFKCRPALPSSSDPTSRQCDDTTAAEPDSASSSLTNADGSATRQGLGAKVNVVDRFKVPFRRQQQQQLNGSRNGCSSSSSSGVMENTYKKSGELPRGSSSSSSGDSPMSEMTTRKSGEVSRVSVSSGASLSGEVPRASCSSSGEMDSDFLHYGNDAHQDELSRYSFELDRPSSQGRRAGASRKSGEAANGGHSSGGSSSGGSPTPEIFNRGRKSVDAAPPHHGSNHSSAGSSEGGSPTAECLWGNAGLVTGGSFSSYSAVTDGSNSNVPVVKKRPTPKEEAISSKGGSTLNNGSFHDAGRLNRFLVGGTSSFPRGNTTKNGIGPKVGPPRGIGLDKNVSAEDFKSAGNYHYKNGNFPEALALYERAIAMCPNHPAYLCNRAAALSSLGRLVEAIRDSETAIKLDPTFIRAHQRLASLNLRLGQVDEARKHLRLAESVGMEANTIEKKLANCLEAKRSGDWDNVIKNCDGAIVAGVDSSVEIYAMKAEALLKLHKLRDAEAVLLTARRLEDANPLSAKKDTLLVLQAQLDMSQGRFDEAVAVAARAARLDARNEKLLNTARAVASARTRGNSHFNAAKYFEACAAYSEGLELDSTNSVLLCNRAASRSKLGQWEKALEDCNAALRVQPTYTKALLRRAQSYAKLERWEAALRDYEAVQREAPGDVEVAQALFEVDLRLRQSRGEELYKTRFGQVEALSRSDRFAKAISRPGVSVVEFTMRWDERCREFSSLVDELSMQYLSVNFARVDVNESPYLVQREQIGSVPTFKIYRNGVKVRELLGPTQQGLEEAVKQCGL